MSLSSPASHPSDTGAEAPARLVSAAQFTLEELTAAYNQTRVDYLIPMPMNAARLAAYVDTYDVDLARSTVAMEGEDILGLCMIGVRPNRTWTTRLGVLAGRRRRGVGGLMMQHLLDTSDTLGAPCSMLEVIAGNTPAHTLFSKLGFEETRELLVLRRPPNPAPPTTCWRVDWLDQSEALDLLASTPSLPLAWTNEIESFRHVTDMQALYVTLENGDRGWLIFRRQKFLLTHFLPHTDHGDPAAVTAAALSHLYARYPLLDSYSENLALLDPHVAVMRQFGFIEAFRRIEMARRNPVNTISEAKNS